MPGQRIARVNELLKREIADQLERLIPMSEGILVSVSSVDTSPDLRHAKVRISILGGENSGQMKVMQLLRRKRYDIQQHIAHDIILKYTPVLEFIQDNNIAQGDRILEIISELDDDPESETDKAD